MNDLTQMQRVNAHGWFGRVAGSWIAHCSSRWPVTMTLRTVTLQVGVSTILFAGVAHAADPCKTVTDLVGVSLNDPASNILGYMQISVQTAKPGT
jgi:hypothetical protein